MSAASREDILDWISEGKRAKATHLIVVCDTFDWEDYPVFANGKSDLLSKCAHYNGQNMQSIMEVYDLRLDTNMQVSEHRAYYGYRPGYGAYYPPGVQSPDDEPKKAKPKAKKDTKKKAKRIKK